MDKQNRDLQLDLDVTVAKVQKANDDYVSLSRHVAQLQNDRDRLNLERSALQEELRTLKTQIEQHEKSAQLFEQAFQQARGKSAA